MGIDYEAIARRLENRKAVYDKPHPWEQEQFSIGPWELGYDFYYPLNRDAVHAVDFWYKSFYARRAIHKFLQRCQGITTIEIYAMLLHGKIQPPHRNECAKCNEIRELRKKVKKNGRL